jgi:acyl-CoA thioesterase
LPETAAPEILQGAPPEPQGGRVPEDPQAIAQRSAASMYDADLASRHLGIQIDHIAPGRATARMRVRDTMLNGHHICHGGYVFLLADTAFAFACNTYGPTTVAAACDIVFLGPAHLDDELIAEATERHRFGRSGIYDVTVRLPDTTVIAEFRGHSRTLRE